jgi:8-oxo-dGTP diphosphatase
MELLKEIKDNELPHGKSAVKTREASRAVLFDGNGLVALLFVAKHDYHKLPGGGIEVGEDREMALSREIREETGCGIAVTGEVGAVVEFRSRWNLEQTSYCYLGTVISKGVPKFTEKESSQEFRLVWMSLDQAISRLEHDRPNNYEGSFIQQRDLVFLQKSRQLLDAK